MYIYIYTYIYTYIYIYIYYIYNIYLFPKTAPVGSPLQGARLLWVSWIPV